jgi:hypothetical protein
MSQGNIFENEGAMLMQLESMGMPREMIANLTPEQKQAMLAMTNRPEIQQRAQERVAHEEDWKSEGDYQWKNTRDEVFAKFVIKENDVECQIESQHLRVKVGGTEIISRHLFQKVDVERSAWEVKGEELLISLAKAQAPMRWLTLFR